MGDEFEVDDESIRFDDALDDEIDEVEVPDVEDIIEADDPSTSFEVGLSDDLRKSFEAASGRGDHEERTLHYDDESPLSGLDVPVKPDLADRLLKRVYRELNETEGFDVPERLVLGTPQYAVLEPWSQAEHGRSIGDVLPVSNVAVVPGPMVHAGDNKAELLREYVERNTDDE